MWGKKKSIENPKKSRKEDSKTQVKKNLKKQEVGSRWSALVLLFMTVLLSLGFYVYGVISGSQMEIKPAATWQFEAD